MNQGFRDTSLTEIKEVVCEQNYILNSRPGTPLHSGPHIKKKQRYQNVNYFDNKMEYTCPNNILTKVY